MYIFKKQHFAKFEGDASMNRFIACQSIYAVNEVSNSSNDAKAVYYTKLFTVPYNIALPKLKLIDQPHHNFSKRNLHVFSTKMMKVLLL